MMVSPTLVSAISLMPAVGCEHADPVDIAGGAGLHEADLLTGPDRAIDDTHQNDHAQIGVVPAVDQQRLQRRLRIARLGRRQIGDDRLEQFGDADAALGRDGDGV